MHRIRMLEAGPFADIGKIFGVDEFCWRYCMAIR
jgi:hypothetical protein